MYFLTPVDAFADLWYNQTAKGKKRKSSRRNGERRKHNKQRAELGVQHVVTWWKPMLFMRISVSYKKRTNKSP